MVVLVLVPPVLPLLQGVTAVGGGGAGGDGRRPTWEVYEDRVTASSSGGGASLGFLIELLQYEGVGEG